MARRQEAQAAVASTPADTPDLPLVLPSSTSLPSKMRAPSVSDADFVLPQNNQ
jgi:hypothetical protein